MSELSPQGLEIKDEFPEKSINERLFASDGGSISAVSPVSSTLNLMPVHQGARLTGETSCSVKQSCASCGEESVRTVSGKVDFMCKPQSSSDDEEDLGITFYSNDYLDTDPLCEEVLLLEIDGYWKCEKCLKEGKKEAASGPKIQLGDLLKKALSNN